MQRGHDTKETRAIEDGPEDEPEKPKKWAAVGATPTPTPIPIPIPTTPA